MSSLTRNLTCQNKVRILDTFGTQLIFQFLGARNQHESQLVQLTPHSVVLLGAAHREQRDVEVQSLKQSF